MVLSACLIPVDVWGDANACAQSIRVDAQQMHGTSDRSWAIIITIAVTHLLRVFLTVRSACKEGAECPKLLQKFAAAFCCGPLIEVQQTIIIALWECAGRSPDWTLPHFESSPLCVTENV